MKHTRCAEPVICNKTKCWYEHDPEGTTQLEYQPKS
ncbi:unnamed protein product, partial [Rotaria magnacalcarata]